ncbi:MAG TPA: Rrf2 family transcriptional regulator [Gemmatimonadaceae bacterium]|nr:Rrf2 family transcriptional regulator [Gemmatimonadaceae bacterium]
MLLPQTAEYALRAVLHIASHEGPARVGQIASAIDVPQNYLSKTLNQLVRVGVLTSARGPAGGFQLALPPDALTLERIVSAFSGMRARRCLLGMGTCGEVPHCAAHVRWSPVGTQVSDFFARTTVADLLHTPSPPTFEVIQ